MWLYVNSFCDIHIGRLYDMFSDFLVVLHVPFIVGILYLVASRDKKEPRILNYHCLLITFC